jgi:TolA-binding protein
LASTSLPIAADNPPGALAIAARDPRIAQRVVQRPRAILRAEIQSLDTLLTATSKASPDRPALARRLADNYAEVARQTDGPEAKAAHESAAKYYELLAADYPQQPQVDEAFYYLGLESELAGNVPRARVAYLDMLRRVPSSKLAPLAYFAFGEIFRDEAVTDPQKIDFAKQAYVEVLKYPAPNNPVFADAKRRLAEIKARLDGAQP